jgi:hypothetical protein
VKYTGYRATIDAAFRELWPNLPEGEYIVGESWTDGCTRLLNTRMDPVYKLGEDGVKYPPASEVASLTLGEEVTIDIDPMSAMLA